MVTDHNPLVYLQPQSNLSIARREVRWSEYLQAFRFCWQYRPGQHPLTPASLDVDHKVPAAEAFAEDLQAAVEQAKEAWASAQQRQS